MNLERNNISKVNVWIMLDNAFKLSKSQIEHANITVIHTNVCVRVAIRYLL